MRRYLLAAVAGLLLTAGCDPGRAPDPGGAATPATPATPAAASGAPSATVSSPSQNSGPAVPAATSPTPRPPVTSDPDNPRDLVGPPVVLTGTVHRGHDCVILEAHDHRWALTGAGVTGLADGGHVTVRGRPIAVPAGCAADFGLALRASSGT
jgi:hypothetical protein